MSLIVTGSIGIDTVEAPTGSASDVLGGSASYFAPAASFFGPVRVVGAVGEDWPDDYFDAFRRFGCDIQGIEKRPGSKTFRWHGRYMEDMNDRETIDVQLNVLGEEFPPVPEQYRDSKYVFLANTHPDAQRQLLQQFPNRRLAVADTMDLWIQNERASLEALMKELDGLVLNDAEALELTGTGNVVAAAEKIVEMGPDFVVIKKGAHGALLQHKDGLGNLPAYPAKAVKDPTGAGDSFAGGMMGHLAATEDLSLPNLRTAIAQGTIVASFNLEAFSLERLNTLKREEIDQRVSEFREMCSF